MIEIKVTDLENACAELKTEVGANDFRMQAELILLNAKREVLNALEDAKVRERDIMAKQNADEVARQLNAYREAGIDEEKAWELARQQALMAPFGRIAMGGWSNGCA